MQIDARLLLAADAAPGRVIPDRTHVAIIRHQHLFSVLHRINGFQEKRIELEMRGVDRVPVQSDFERRKPPVM
jgi:hypothetical protein